MACKHKWHLLQVRVVASVKARKTGAPVQSSLKGFVKRPAAPKAEAMQPCDDVSAEPRADPDLARALAVSLAEAPKPIPPIGTAEASAREPSDHDRRGAGEDVQGRASK